MNYIIKKIFFFSFTSIFVIGCTSKTNTIDIDLSDLPKPKKIEKKDKVKNDLFKKENDVFVRELVSYQASDQLISKSKFGKRDPFSKGEFNLNKLSSSLKLNGFLNTDINKYVFVTITEPFEKGIYLKYSQIEKTNNIKTPKA